jgi:YVTN family beta-propeller protein
VVGAPIPVNDPGGQIAITPDGTRAYIADFSSKSVTPIDLRTNQALAPIAVEMEPFGLAITPDGRRLYVANFAGDSISVIDIATNTVVDTLRGLGKNPWEIGVSPDGSRIYVSEFESGEVAVIDPHGNQLLPAITGLKQPEYLAVSPDGARLYVTDPGLGILSVIDTAASRVVGSIDVGKQALGPAVTPNGRGIYLSRSVTGAGVTAIDAQAQRVVGTIGKGADALIATVPNQPPVAAFSGPRVRVRPGVPASFNASASKDPDGAVATFGWAFGDRKSASRNAPTIKHAYKTPGRFRATLTLTDDEGCSTAFVFTGQTASCNGSAVATTTKVVKVAFPGVRARCPKNAGGACRFRLQAISGKGKAQSVTARARVKAGKSAIVSLKPKKAFRAKLARAKRVRVRQTVTVGGSHATSVRKLKIVQ